MFDEYRQKNSQQNINKPNPIALKKKILHDQLGFILAPQEWFNTCNVIYHIDKR